MKWVLFSAIIIATLSFYLVRKSHKNNVCKTFSDYYTDRDSNENCYYNPDADLTTNLIIERHGYPVEIHKTTTEDGYIITMFRIPHGKTKSDNKNQTSRQPVFLLNGVSLNSDGFVILGKKSLGFILADAGFDVWLGNYRGTKYARNHVNLTLQDTKFWDYSAHEIGTYDVSSQIDVVTNITKQKVVYIGYSLGAASAFLYGSTYPEAAEHKIKMVIALSPAVYFFGCKSVVCTHLFPLWQYVKPVVDWFTYGRIHLRQPPGGSRSILCFPFPFQMKMCQIADMTLWGFDYEQNDAETLPITLMHNDDAISTKLLSHLIQLHFNGGKYENYDYGSDLNIRRYGTPDPPLYELSKFRVPVYIVRGENDLTIAKGDIEKLNSSLPEEVKPHDIYVVKYDKFNHGDFMQARDIVPLLYNHVVEFIGKL